MKSTEIRQAFIDFFKAQNHTYIPSSSIVLSDDPSLMFVNAGMNQFKDIFLGHKIPPVSAAVNSQKCLRVSGKHNDIEEVGHDTYHHTMFEMLGNWSFSDYFKKEAICFAWDFLTKELKISEERLYVSYFNGDSKDKLQEDLETKNIWHKIVKSDKIVSGSKKDNFWEMGKIGPCGPCTEIHIDLRSDSERKKFPAQSLINKDHPQVIEIWNIVFVEFNRKEDNELEALPNKHVDTGMGFERLCMVLQGKISTYDTDLFEDLINYISKYSKVTYGDNEKTDIAIRVIVDHIRAITFSIADGQLPSNNGAGYVIRRILRRAVRYGYTYLNLEQPFLYNLVDLLSSQFKSTFPEINREKNIIKNVIQEEEKLFLKTLGKGMSLINNLIENACEKNLISGVEVFKLYDTYGFPPDLTSLILQENKLNYNKKAFDECMNNQKNQSKVASDVKIGDWIEVQDSESDGFIGYSQTSVNNVKLLKHRKIKIKNEYRFQLVFNKTPFYPEGGGQTADTGKIFVSNNINGDIFSFSVIDTKKENNLIVHTVLDHESRLEHYLGNFAYELTINKINRKLTSRNHSATHLLNHELRNLFGHHIEQKGSYVGPNYFRFDFSHFNKIEQKDLDLLEDRINNCIHQGVSLKESNNVPIEVARKNGALSLFGEKYDNTVRVIEFGDSIELCGGTHVSKTSEIGLFKIISESSIAAGIRRIEAVTSLSALNYVNKQLSTLNQIKVLLKNNDNILAQVSRLIKENKDLDKLSKDVKKNQADSLIKNLESKIKHINKVKFISTQLQVDPETMKNICFSLINKYDNIFIVLSTQKNNKVILNIALSKSLVNKRKINASKLINEVGVHVNARGGGQPFFAVASGDNLDGVDNIFQDLEKIIKDS